MSVPPCPPYIAPCLSLRSPPVETDFNSHPPTAASLPSLSSYRNPRHPGQADAAPGEGKKKRPAVTQRRRETRRGQQSGCCWRKKKRHVHLQLLQLLAACLSRFFLFPLLCTQQDEQARRRSSGASCPSLHSLCVARLHRGEREREREGKKKIIVGYILVIYSKGALWLRWLLRLTTTNFTNQPTTPAAAPGWPDC